MFFYLAIIISIIGLIIATYTDLKERIVPNKLNFSLAIIGLIIYSIWSITIQDITPLLLSMLGLIFGFTFGWVLWKLGVFAGGDVKLFMGLGALNPFTPAIINYGLLTNSSMPIFPITLFLYSLIAFLPYGLFIIITKLIKKKKEREIIISKLKENSINGIRISITIAFIYTIFLVFLPEINILIKIITIIITGLIIHKINENIRRPLEFIILIIGIITNVLIFIQSFLAISILIIFLFGILKLLLSAKILLIEKIKINDLKEGMIPQKSLIKKGKKIIEVDGLSINKIINYTLNKRINEIISEKDEIISANKARGLTLEEIKLLKKLSKQKIIRKTINIKESMPFVPTMLISYILCLIFGDFLIIILAGI